MKVVVQYPERSAHSNDNGIQHFSMASLTTAPDEKDDIDFLMTGLTTAESFSDGDDDKNSEDKPKEIQQFS